MISLAFNLVYIYDLIFYIIQLCKNLKCIWVYQHIEIGYLQCIYNNEYRYEHRGIPMLIFTAALPATFLLKIISIVCIILTILYISEEYTELELELHGRRIFLQLYCRKVSIIIYTALFFLLIMLTYFLKL